MAALLHRGTSPPSLGGKKRTNDSDDRVDDVLPVEDGRGQVPWCQRGQQVQEGDPGQQA